MLCKTTLQLGASEIYANSPASLLVTAIPSKVISLSDRHSLSIDLLQRRNLLRLTAKSTQFGKRTLTSWLIESAGTVPIYRRKDFPDGRADNTDVMLKLVEVRIILRVRSSRFVSDANTCVLISSTGSRVR